MDDSRGHPQGANEGEGSRVADEQCRKQPATEFAPGTDTLQKGLDAERDVENYRDEYDRAEKSRRTHRAGDLHGDLEGTSDRRR